MPAVSLQHAISCMAIYSLHVKTVSRSAGRSVVAAAAYRAAESIGDDRLGVVWDFTRKYGVLHSEIITPSDAPSWARDRAELWNAAERAEDKSTRRQSATTGRDIILALPHELSDAQRISAVREFAAGLVERYGVAIDFAIHAPDRHSDERNYHAHVLMTTRQIGPGGFGAKTRELDSFRTGPREIEAIRQQWERIGNRALEEAGIDIRIDCRSYADRGIDREATVHLGPVASGMERNGEGSDLGDRNRGAQARNAERERIARYRRFKPLNSARRMGVQGTAPAVTALPQVMHKCAMFRLLDEYVDRLHDRMLFRFLPEPEEPSRIESVF
jgi:ATP-dependent exoDNAse (exonuclease V) alpha subunit